MFRSAPLVPSLQQTHQKRWVKVQSALGAWLVCTHDCVELTISVDTSPPHVALPPHTGDNLGLHHFCDYSPSGLLDTRVNMKSARSYVLL